MASSLKFVICGKNGQLSSAFSKLVSHDTVYFSHNEVDFTSLDSVTAAFTKHAPDVIINLCAYTNVEKAEDHKEQAYKANAETPKTLAKYCAQNNVILVHFSTDYVYAGEGNAPQSETTELSPLNIYGLSKLQGENEIVKINCKHLIFRTSWLFDGKSKNFFTTMMSLSMQRQTLSIINDQIGAPTHTYHLAQATLKAVNNAIKTDVFPSGIYNLCSSGEVSWFNYASLIFEKSEEKGCDLLLKCVKSVPSESYKTKAKRPLNSRLDCFKASEILNVKMPSWEEGVTLAMDESFEIN